MNWLLNAPSGSAGLTRGCLLEGLVSCNMSGARERGFSPAAKGVISEQERGGPRLATRSGRPLTGSDRQLTGNDGRGAWANIVDLVLIWEDCG